MTKGKIQMLAKNWQDLIKPTKLDVAPSKSNPNVATIVAEPLERGFGHTLGVAIRRVLLSSLQGAAVTSVKIDGVLHEFSSVPGVREDVTDIILNIKELRLKTGGSEKKRITLSATGPGEVKASAIETSGDLEIINKDHVICTLDKGAKLHMEMTVETGKGYVRGTKPSDAPIGLIPVDALFSPVIKVTYKVDHARVGQITDYDKLSMTVETDGSISAEDAVALAARILQDQLQLFINFEESKIERKEEAKPIASKTIISFMWAILCRKPKVKCLKRQISAASRSMKSKKNCRKSAFVSVWKFQVGHLKILRNSHVSMRIRINRESCFVSRG
jgi:DNA-directed RNA polymerase subunit alpha